MTEVLIAAATGLMINLITWLSGKLNLSKTYVSVGLSIFIGIAIYVVQIIIDKYPMQWDQILAFASWAYAMSQFIYNIVIKITESKQK